jgi:aryl-alcohol dehydrogenase-like predicted oxidoreductase
MSRGPKIGQLIRVPHSSGMLEGKYTKDTVFGENDHRKHRPKEWLTEGLQKIEKLEFLTKDTGRPSSLVRDFPGSSGTSGGRTLAQAARYSRLIVR